MTIREEAFLGQPISCPVIDAHTHISTSHFDGWHQKYDRISTADILEDLDRLGIDCIVTAPHPLLQGRMEEANEMAEAAAKEFPGKVYGYISVVPGCGMDAVKEQIAKYSKNPAFLGLKFLAGSHYHGKMYLPEYQYALDFADEVRCPVLCHSYANVPSLEEFTSAIENRHRLKLIVAHQGGGMAKYTRMTVPVLREYENVYLEICGSMDNQLPMEALVEMMGEDRVIFGTDAINLDPKYEIGKVALSPLSDWVKKKIFADNYLHLLETSQMGHISL